MKHRLGRRSTLRHRLFFSLDILSSCFRVRLFAYEDRFSAFFLLVSIFFYVRYVDFFRSLHKARDEETVPCTRRAPRTINGRPLRVGGWVGGSGFILPTSINKHERFEDDARCSVWLKMCRRTEFRIKLMIFVAF